ncbi:hypothetical protein D6764_01695 [Candidatus Woesearchaeota archaeon]|nr:MAG: hypothetical protein D6764_01695 [Candidatus Woesearchaeota archaeon]
MVLKQLARDYERRRQKIIFFLSRHNLSDSRKKELEEQLSEVERIISVLRSSSTSQEVYEHFKRRIRYLIRKTSKKAAVFELRNFLQALVHAEKTKSKLEVNLKGMPLKPKKNIKKEYSEKLKPLIDDFLSEGY